MVTATIVARPGASEMTPLPIPNPSVPAAAQSPLEQVMALKTLVRQLSDSGEVGTREGGELDRLLNDVANQIVQGKSKEAQDKIAAVRKKNDDLLRDRKISVAGHDAIASRLAQLSEAVAATAG